MDEFDVDDWLKIVDAYVSNEIDAYGALAYGSINRANAAGNEKLGKILERLFEVERYGDLEDIAREIFPDRKDSSNIPLDNLQDYDDYLNEEYPDNLFSNNSEPIHVITPARDLPPGDWCTENLIIDARTYWKDFTCLGYCMWLVDEIKKGKITTENALQKLVVTEKSRISKSCGEARQMIESCYRDNPPPSKPQKSVLLLWPHPITFSRATIIGGEKNRPHPEQMKEYRRLKSFCVDKGIHLATRLC